VLCEGGISHLSLTIRIFYLILTIWHLCKIDASGDIEDDEIPYFLKYYVFGKGNGIALRGCRVDLEIARYTSAPILICISIRCNVNEILI
jgi:hypothetical protein